MMAESKNCNVSRHLFDRAKEVPGKTASIDSKGHSISFAHMDAETSRMANVFSKVGIGRGTRVATLVRPGLNFVPVIFGLFRVGAVPVFIDPGMKLKNMLLCLKEVRPEALVGVPLAHMLTKLFPGAFESVKTRLCLSSSPILPILFGSKYVHSVCHCSHVQAAPENVGVVLGESDPAAIIFTSGSTGVPKGVELTHGIFEQQQSILKETYGVGSDEIDLVPFPLFALFSAAWGITSIIPDMDPAKPAKVNGAKLAKTIQKYGVTHTAGSPAIFRRIMLACKKKNIQLPSLRRILMAGAPVSEKIIRDAKEVMGASGRVYTPYGATEALPLTNIGDVELLGDCFAQTRSGKGVCVGRPLSHVDMRVIQISDEPLERWAQVTPLGVNQIGEIVVQGKIVTRSYFNRPDSNRMAKIFDQEPGEGSFWHRMGDLGYIDDDGKLWLCGRKDHRVSLENNELYPVQCEGIFNQHPHVLRSALVGVRGSQGQVLPVLVVQGEPSSEREKVRVDLLRMAKEMELTAGIRTIIFKDEFPTDVRHNIKIDRPALSQYAQSRVEHL